MNILAVTSLVLALGVSCTLSKTFCKGLECPNFTLLNSSQGFETRKYGSLTFAYTSYTGPWYSNVLGELFNKLYEFIQGTNTLKLTIPMTVPVLTEIESTAQGTKYTMKFVIPSQHLVNVPKPLDNMVFLTTEPETIYFVRTFGGFADGQVYMTELQGLVNSINDTTLYDNNIFYTATYDSPMEKINRHNEVWLKKN